MENKIIRLLVIEESANDAEVILNTLRKARYPIRPIHVEDDEDLQEALEDQEWDLIISVPEVGDFTVPQVCEMVKSSGQDIPIIVVNCNCDNYLVSIVKFELDNLAKCRESTDNDKYKKIELNLRAKELKLKERELNIVEFEHGINQKS